MGFSNGVNLLPNGEDAEVGTCMAPAPYAPVVRGGYTVTHAELAIASPVGGVCHGPPRATRRPPPGGRLEWPAASYALAASEPHFLKRL